LWAQVRPIVMVRRKASLGLAFLLAAGLCLPVGEAVAQNAPPKSASLATTPSTVQPKTHARRKKAAPDPPVPQAPAPPPTLEQSAPVAPQVTYHNMQLTVIAQNSTLSQVLRSVQVLTGASVEMPSGASNERVVGQFGPGEPTNVLNALLNGSKFNYIILGVAGNPGAVQKVILTTAKPASSVSTAQNNSTPQPEEPPDEESYNEPEPQPGPQRPMPSQFHHPPNMPGRVPQGFNQQPQPQPTPENGTENTQPGAKTPEQLLQELQQMQQQQQQMQEQLNPANRQPPP
jgi:hypothetical protein